MSTTPVCLECLTTFAEEGRQVCPSCQRSLEMRAAFERGWRGGWAAALDVHGFVRRDDEPVGT